MLTTRYKKFFFEDERWRSLGSIEYALKCKRSGLLKRARKMLKLISSTGSVSDSKIALYELALLYSQMGLQKKSDRCLMKIGFSHKLSPQILYPTQRVDLRECFRNSSLVAVHENILPLNILQRLQYALNPEAPFWSEHSYPNDIFFSYNTKIPIGEETAENLIQCVAQFIRPLVLQSFPNAIDADSVEWWAHCRDCDGNEGHQLHFDMDERALRLNGDIHPELHPFVSAVLYLSDTNGAQAPTVITDQTLHEDSVASEAWLCYPALNKLLLFDGSLLHGVIPFLPKKRAACVNMHSRLKSIRRGRGAAPPTRITLMLGWWHKGVHLTDPPDVDKSQHSTNPTLGPNMSMPIELSRSSMKSSGHTTTSAVAVTSETAPPRWRCRYLQEEVSWPQSFQLPSTESIFPISKFLPLHSDSTTAGSAVTSSAYSATGLVHVPGPIWVKVNGIEKEEAKQIKSRKRLRHTHRPSNEATGSHEFKKLRRAALDVRPLVRTDTAPTNREMKLSGEIKFDHNDDHDDDDGSDGEEGDDGDVDDDDDDSSHAKFIPTRMSMESIEYVTMEQLQSLRAASINNNSLRTESAPKAINAAIEGAVDFITMEQLRALRDKTSAGISIASSSSLPSSFSALPITSLQNVSSREISSRATSDGGHVEFITMKELQALRSHCTDDINKHTLTSADSGGDNEGTNEAEVLDSTASDEDGHNDRGFAEEEEEEEEEGDDVVFVGRWFVKSLREIRNSVIRRC